MFVKLLITPLAFNTPRTLICDALRNLVPFLENLKNLQFKKCEKHP